LTSLGPKFLGHTQRYGKNESQGPKKEYFQKMKRKALGIHLFYKFAKFQHDYAIFDFTKLPKVLEKNGSQGPKREDFQKMKIITVRYSSNL